MSFKQTRTRVKEHGWGGDKITQQFTSGPRAARTRADADFVLGTLQTAGAGALTPRINGMQLRRQGPIAVLGVEYRGSKLYSAT